VEHTSLWPEFIATSNCDSQTVVKHFFDVVVARFGTPFGITLRSDLGAAFISQVTRDFCSALSVTQVYSSPYHHTAVSRAEQAIQPVHNTLRIVCQNQRDWPSHLQAIAFAMRCTPSSATGLSPFEIWHGRPMPLPWDIAVSDVPTTIPSLESYTADIRAKIEIFRATAAQNAVASADRHRAARNANTVTPNFKAGDKVLLQNESKRPHESAKLRNRWAGPMIITKCETGFRYRLQHLVTGKTLKNPVHASRLKLLREMDNTQISSHMRIRPCMFSAHTPHRNLEVKVMIADIVSIDADVIVNPTDGQLKHETGVSHAIITAAGDRTRTACAEYIRLHKQLPPAGPISTTAGNLEPRVKALLHVQSDNTLTCAKLTDTLNACLQHADNMRETSSIAFPAIGDGTSRIDVWQIGECAAQGVLKFDTDSAAQPGSLRTIKFVALSLTAADALTAAFRLAIQESSPDTSGANDATTPPDTTTNDGWYSIERILRHRKHKGRSQYLVKWAQSDAQPSWVDHADVTDNALTQFYANQSLRRRRRRRRH
jgi:O-acetyl-ADP-ribose deacetylase (regulator of RNase III)